MRQPAPLHSLNWWPRTWVDSFPYSLTTVLVGVILLSSSYQGSAWPCLLMSDWSSIDKLCLVIIFVDALTLASLPDDREMDVEIKVITRSKLKLPKFHRYPLSLLNQSLRFPRKWKTRLHLTYHNHGLDIGPNPTNTIQNYQQYAHGCDQNAAVFRVYYSQQYPVESSRDSTSFLWQFTYYNVIGTEINAALKSKKLSIFLKLLVVCSVTRGLH